METLSNPYRVHQCLKCQGDTEYYCESCPGCFCSPCKEKHMTNLKTIDHDVVSYRDKFNCTLTQEICVRHPSHIIRQYCESYQIPLCDYCFCFDRCKIISIEEAYRTKRQQHRGTIHTIKTDTLFYRHVLLKKIKNDIKPCQKVFYLYQPEMLTKAKRLKHLINKVLYDLLNNVFCDFHFKHRCLNQMIEMRRRIVTLQRYIHIYEQSAISALQFLSSIKKPPLQIHLTLHTSQLSMTESLNKKDVMESLSEIQITERGNRQVGNECLLKLTSSAELHQSLKVKGVNNCRHISCVTSDRVSISDDEHNLILINKTGVTQHRLKDLCRDIYGGSHTMNCENELIYIDGNYNINKLSKDMKTTTPFIERTDSTWRPRCVYWSPSTGDLLVGMYNDDKKKGIVTRYNKIKTPIQTMQHDDNGLYSKPRYITENNNEDVVVSDNDAVVVTERGGRHRFSYKGPPLGSGLRPRGICTDALSHILVCDDRTKTVQIINKDGQFLLYLELLKIPKPYSLGYEVNTHRLWVGSKNTSQMHVYIYMERYDTTSVQSPTTDHVTEFKSGIQTTETETQEPENECLPKMRFPPKVLCSLKVKGVDKCDHISIVTSDRILVSNNRNLVLTNRNGDKLYRRKNSHAYTDLFNDFYGEHTVNSQGEIVYIDKNHDIQKISNIMGRTTALIKTKHSGFFNHCVYCSPSTGDLLVGVSDTSTAMVKRYSQTGKLTQIMRHDKRNRALYTDPHFITENKNRDVVVSDSFNGSGAVVVTERGGRHRFTYTRHPSGLRLEPRGICTDPLAHILVCDVKSVTVLIIDKDGHFLRFLPLDSLDICRPHSLSYDKNNDCLWVGSGYNNKVCVCRYMKITPERALTDSQNGPDGFALTTSLPI